VCGAADGACYPRQFGESEWWGSRIILADLHCTSSRTHHTTHSHYSPLTPPTRTDRISRLTAHASPLSPLSQRDILDSEPDMPVWRRFQLAVGVVSGVNALHSRPQAILHGDIKAPNVVVDHAGVVKLVDFGQSTNSGLSSMLSKRPGGGAAAGGGTQAYRAPELFREVLDLDFTGIVPYTAQCDIYSTGILLNELASGMAPWAEEYRKRGRQADQYVAKRVWTKNRPERQRNSPSAESAEFFQSQTVRCWAHEPSDRPSAADLHSAFEQEQQQPYFTQPAAGAASAVAFPAEWTVAAAPISAGGGSGSGAGSGSGNWEFASDQGAWQQYDLPCARALEDALAVRNAGGSGTLVLQIRSAVYDVDLSAMLQTNRTTRYARKLRRTGPPPPPPPSGQPQNLELIDVARDSSEWEAVAADRRCASGDILRVTRVQNRFLWTCFSNKRRELQQLRGGAVSEQRLWHGTSNDRSLLDPKMVRLSMHNSCAVAFVLTSLVYCCRFSTAKRDSTTGSRARGISVKGPISRAPTATAETTASQPSTSVDLGSKTRIRSSSLQCWWGIRTQ
jgi:hypothetical protein